MCRAGAAVAVGRMTATVCCLTLTALAGGPSRAEEATTVVLEVAVRDPAAVAIAEVDVALLRPGDEGQAPLVVAQASTDRDGTVSFSVGPGDYRLRASAGGYLEQLTPAIRLGQAARETITMRLFPGTPLTGRVSQLQRGPLSGAEVCLRLENSSSLPAAALGDGILEEGQACAESDDGGAVRFSILPLGRYMVRVEAADLVPLETLLELRGELPLQHWRLRPGGAIRGRLRDVDDQGVPGAKVELRHRQRDLSTDGSTDDEGGFLVSGLAPGTWIVSIDPPDGMALLRDGLSVRSGGTVDLGTLRVRPGSALEGRVMDAGGEGLGDASLRVHEAAGSHRVLKRGRTGEDGRFQLGGLPEDRELLVVAEPPQGYAARILEELHAPRRDLRIEVEDAGSVCGAVSVDGGDLPDSIRVTTETQTEGWLRRLDELTRAGTEDVDTRSGAFCVQDVLPGEEVELTARAAGYWSEPVVVQVDPGRETGPVELRLQRGLALDGSVVDREGGAIAEALVGSSGKRAVFSDTRGEFRLEGLRPGMNTVVASHRDYATSEREIMLPVPADQDVVLELGRGGTIVGSVLDYDRQPVDGVTIRVDGGQRAVTGPDGRYRLDRVSRGGHSVRREADRGYADFEERKVEVAEGETVTVDFLLGAVLEGRLLRGSAPVSGAAISLAQPSDWDDSFRSHAARQTFSDADGHYRLPGVQAGWGTITVIDGWQRFIRPVEVPSGREPHLDLPLPDQLVNGSVLAAADDRAIAGASIIARLPEAPGVPSASGSSYFSRSDSLGQSMTYSITTRPQVRTSSGPAGDFELYVEGSGENDVTVFMQGFESDSETVGPGDTGPLLFRLSRKLLFVVRLRDAGGRPLGVAEVCFHYDSSSGGQNRSCGTTHSDRIEQSLREGHYTILAGSPGFGTRVLEHQITVSEGDDHDELTLQLVPGAAVWIILVGQPSETARVVSLLDAAGNDRTVLVKPGNTDPATGDRRWRTWPLEPGLWQVTVDPGTGELLRKEIEVVPGPELELVFP